MIVLLAAVFAVILFLEVPGMVKKRQWRELTVYSVLMAIALVISAMYILDLDVPNPVKNTQYYVQSLVKHLFGLSYD
mgnify:CR=1 FL=1